MAEILIGKDTKINLEKKGEDFIIDGKKTDSQLIREGERTFKIFTDNKIYHAEILENDENELLINVNGKNISVSVSDPMEEILKKLGMSSGGSSSVREIKAPMPGTILSVTVKPGDSVNKGDSLLILEAMKMENVIKSPGEGTIKTIPVKEGDNVEKNQILISFD